MEHIVRIDAVKCRAAEIRISLRELCTGAGVSIATISRWSQDGSNPTMRVFNRTLPKLEAELERRELDLLKHLLRFHDVAELQDQAA